MCVCVYIYIYIFNLEKKGNETLKRVIVIKHSVVDDPCPIVAHGLDCVVVCVHFQTNTLRKGMNPLIISAMG